MFERFTAGTRQAIALAQDEARALDHNYIGTEHLLLGLLAEARGIAYRALTSLGITLDATRDLVTAHIGRGVQPPTGRIPFTPRAKKTLELGLREALGQGHNYIETEDILLALDRRGEGMGAHFLEQQGVGSEALRQAITDIAATSATGSRPLRRNLFRPGGQSSASGALVTRTTKATDDSLDVARRLAGADAIGSHHLLLATLTDPTNAASRALANLGVNLDDARRALQEADVAGTADELPQQAGRRLIDCGSPTTSCSWKSPMPR